MLDHYHHYQCWYGCLCHSLWAYRQMKSQLYLFMQLGQIL